MSKFDKFLISEEKKADKKAKWMAAYETALSKKEGHKAGRVCWDTANHLYNMGMTPEEAAKEVKGAYKDDKDR